MDTNGIESAPVREDGADFYDLDDLQVAHSPITIERFCSGPLGEEQVIKRIKNIENDAVRNDAMFRIAKLMYESRNNIIEALDLVEKISNPNEQARCFVHLAIAVLQNEGNRQLADEIIAKIKVDDEGYINFYDKEKARFASAE